MSYLTDIATVPVLDVWGDSVRARRIEGERITFALIELAPDSIVPGHRHENEQLGMVITGSVTFTIGDRPRPGFLGSVPGLPPDAGICATPAAARRRFRREDLPPDV